LPAKKSKIKKTKAKKPKLSAKQVITKTAERVRTLGGFNPIVAPDIGHKPAYNGSDLLTNLSQQSADLLALQFREEVANAFSKQKISDFYLILSGTLGSQLWFTSPYFGRGTSDIDISLG
jgi:hypothetical protein